MINSKEELVLKMDECFQEFCKEEKIIPTEQNRLIFYSGYEKGLLYTREILENAGVA